jgi:hypothetical protein
VGPAVITGFNTNIRHRVRLFHVQTEDSGRSNPHVISHLYFGGTILASQKTEYAEQLASENLDNIVRELMESQHKSMLKRLRAGEFDQTISERLGGETAEGSTTSPSIHDEPPPAPAQPAAARLPAASATPAGSTKTGDPASGDRVFGDGVVSHKPLDEVILEYLVEKARDRGGRTTAPPKQRPRDTRSRG